jgi:hypothetical protein
VNYAEKHGNWEAEMCDREDGTTMEERKERFNQRK